MHNRKKIMGSSKFFYNVLVETVNKIKLNSHRTIRS